MAVSPCDAIAERLFEFLDGELRAEDEAAVRRHLGACPSCAGAVERDEAFLRIIARGGRVEPAPDSLRARVAAMLAARRPGEGGGDASPPPPSPDCSKNPS